VPLFVMAVIMTTTTTTTTTTISKDSSSDNVVYTIFTQAHMGKHLDYNDATWQCLYTTHPMQNDGNDDDDDDDDDDDSLNSTTTSIHVTTSTTPSMITAASFAPRHRSKGRGNLVLICNATQRSGGDNNGDNDGDTAAAATAHYLYGIQPILKVPSPPPPPPPPPPLSNATTIASLPSFEYYDLRLSLRCSRLESQRHRQQQQQPKQQQTSKLKQVATTTTTDTATTRNQSTTPPPPPPPLLLHATNNNNNINNSNKIGACLRFQGDFDRSILPQWIEYHRLLGIDHFWIYVNEPWSWQHQEEELEEGGGGGGGFLHHHHHHPSYVTYLAFDQQWQDHAHYYQHYYHRTLDNGGDHQEVVVAPSTQWTLTQEPAQTSCLYLAKTLGYDWITTPDVDEYLFLSKTNNDNNNDDENENENHDDDNHDLPPLKQFLSQFDKEQYSSLIVNSIPYGSNAFVQRQQQQEEELTKKKNNNNNNNNITTTTTPVPLMIDYVWRRRHWNLTDYPFGRYKQFYNVRTVWSVGVHYCFAVTTGNTRAVANVPVPPTMSHQLVHWAHYKRAHLGVFQRGEAVMVRSADQLQRDTRVRDTYQSDLVERMRALGLLVEEEKEKEGGREKMEPR
jgi:hypothetical protein